ncbi:MAG: phosphoenolpyruvate carboxykinase (ATP) [Dehalococcoidales bacterium]|nr:phosphoenolpyruvate carboxykinase (ATP) [Dehalococcoidales bacterium]
MSARFDLEEFARVAERIRAKAKTDGRLLENPPDEAMRVLVEKEQGVRKTIYDNFVAESEPTSRSQMFTKNSIDEEFGEAERELLAKCEQALAKEKLICIDRTVGSLDSDTIVRLIVPEKFAHIAYGGKNLFAPVKKTNYQPDYQIIFFGDEAWETNKTKPLPQKDITIRLAVLDGGRIVKIIRNSNYIGEYKKGVFAAEDWVAKTKKGGIFLHAGCREDVLQMAHGNYRSVRTLLIALTANGKTTTTCRVIARKGKEKSWLVQDDGGTLMADGSFHGFEAGGIFVKTEGVNPGEQVEIYYGLLKRETVCENVFVTEDGDFDFENFSRTSNGRAVVRRVDFMHASPYIDVDQVDNIVLITRGPLIPAISKLTPEQAAALMVLGQAMESSAGDPTQAGKIRSEFFYDPFMAGDKAKHANIFYEIIKGLPHLNFYLINTRGVGEDEHFKVIPVAHTLAILDSLFRGGLEDWVDSPSGFKVPAAIRAVDDITVHPEKLYTREEFEQKQKELNRVRYEAVEKIGPDLHPDIQKVFARPSEYQIRWQI